MVMSFWSVPIVKTGQIGGIGDKTVFATTTYDMSASRHHYLYCPLWKLVLGWSQLKITLFVGLLLAIPAWFLIDFVRHMWDLDPEITRTGRLLLTIAVCLVGGHFLGFVQGIEDRMRGLAHEERGWNDTVRFKVVRDEEWEQFQKQLFKGGF